MTFPPIFPIPNMLCVNFEVSSLEGVRGNGSPWGHTVSEVAPGLPWEKGVLVKVFQRNVANRTHVYVYMCIYKDRETETDTKIY